MKVAAVDIGTNSVLLLIAERHCDALEARLERATITRLGQGVDRSRSLHPEASQRTLACLRDYATEIATHGVERAAAVGTSALRDAAGAISFLDEAERILGVRPAVISGEEEARFTFAGALSGLGVQGAASVFDVGGGSTELVHGNAGPPPRLTHAQSLDIGSVRLTERLVHGDPPTLAEIQQVRAAVRAELAAVPRPAAGATLVGVAGTVTQLAALHLGLAAYDPARVHGCTLTARALDAQLHRLAALSSAERRQLPGMEPKRADVIVAGASLCAEVLLWAERDSLLVSDRGVRWGLAAALSDFS